MEVKTVKNLKKLVYLILIFSIFILSGIPKVAAAPVKFTDVKAASWYYTYVTRLVELNITAGIGNNQYGPNKSVTRAEFVTFLINATGRTKIDGYTYSDTQKHWARQYISAAVDANFIDKGISFNPNKAITRQEAVEMLCRSINLQADSTLQTPYADVIENSGYSSTAYNEFLMMGSVENDKRYFKPTSNITRAETAAILVNLVDYKANPEGYKASKKAEIEKKEKEAQEAKAEEEKYQEWMKTIEKGVSKELLNNMQGIYGGKTVRECNEYAINQLKNYSAWYKNSKVQSHEEFLNKIIEVGTGFMMSYHNRSYLKIDEFNSNMKKYWATFNYVNFFNSKMARPTKNYTIVKEGKFYAGKGMIFMGQFGPVLHGTVRARYLAPTSQEKLNKDICEETGKPSELNVWYEYDVEMTFIADQDGLKVTKDDIISTGRVAR